MSETLADRIRNGIMDGWSSDAPCLSDDLAREAADRLEALEAAIDRALRVMTYPVSTQIDPRGFSLHSPSDDKWEYLLEVLSLPTPPSSSTQG